LTFGGASSDRVQVAAATNINDLTTLTMLAWVFPTTLTGNRCIMAKATSATAGKLFRINGTGGNIELLINRATDTQYVTNDTPLATTSKWYLVAATFDSGASPPVHMYVGDLAAVAAERTYGVQTAGSGSVDADNAINLVLGNHAGNNVAFQGRIAVAAYINRVLTLGEIKQWQFRPRVLVGTVGLWMLGYNGTSTQADLSGSGNPGTVTGASVGDHVPLRPLWGGAAQSWVATAAAASAVRRHAVHSGVGEGVLRGVA